MIEALLGQSLVDAFDPQCLTSRVYAPVRRSSGPTRRALGWILKSIGAPTTPTFAPTGLEDRGDYGVTHWHDVIQGNAATCYLLASLVALLYQGRPLPHCPVPPIGSPGDQELHRHRFRFFRDSAWQEVEVDEQLRVRPRNPSLLGASSRRQGHLWPGLWEKAYCKLTTGAEDIDCLPRSGSARAVLSLLTGREPARLDSEGIFTLPRHRSGELREPVVIDTTNPASQKGLACWQDGHSYAGLGIIEKGRDRVVVVYDPAGRRGVCSQHLPWGTLRGTVWGPYSDPTDVDSGVLPIPYRDFLDRCQEAWCDSTAVHSA